MNMFLQVHKNDEDNLFSFCQGLCMLIGFPPSLTNRNVFMSWGISKKCFIIWVSMLLVLFSCDVF